MRIVKTKNRKAINPVQEILNSADGLPILDIEDREWWVAYYEGESIAVAAMRVIDDMAWFSTCGVLPDYRGHGLQKKLIKKRLDYAKKLGVKEVYTYTVNGNHASANSLISCGFKHCTPPEEASGQYVGDDIDLIYWRKLFK